MYPDYLVHFNPNHDPKTGQFAPGTGSGEATVNKIGARLKKADLLDINHKEYKTESGPVYKRMKAAADTGLKALLKLGDTDVKLDSPEHWDYWFLFEDQTYGQAQVADLANKGKSKEQIKQVIKDSVEFTLRDYNDEFSEIPGVYSLYLFNEEADYMPFGDADSFIDACIEVAKENRQLKQSGITKFGNYLCHYNKNHSSKNGRFTSGDGDGDGIANDHAHSKSTKGGRLLSKIGSSDKKSGGFHGEYHLRDPLTGQHNKSTGVKLPIKKQGEKEFKNNIILEDRFKRRLERDGAVKGESFVKDLEHLEYDEQKVTAQDGSNIYMTRAMTWALNDLYEEDPEEKKKRARRVVQNDTNSKNWKSRNSKRRKI